MEGGLWRKRSTLRSILTTPAMGSQLEGADILSDGNNQPFSRAIDPRVARLRFKN